ncbi:catalase [Drosophila tropicalis]|uniref:catalase n=1 Tax=Drosophila tropicalis TaxID=46794 RepID=UPI0035AC24CC
MCSRDPASNQLIDYKTNDSEVQKECTTSGGASIGVKDAIQTVGPRGPALLQDFFFLDEMMHFDTERIPERVAYAKGAGAFGYFESTHDITKFCAASLFERVRKRTAIAMRFSVACGENGSADTVREQRGFSVKFYTDDGIWDIVGCNMPVYYVRDPSLFPSLIHAQKRNPQTHLRDPDMFWDFMTLRPETLHALVMYFSDRGTPDGYRHMHGYGAHTYRMVNPSGETYYVKFHFKTDQGIKNLDCRRCDELRSHDPDYAIRDMYNSIKKCNYPSWSMFIQVMLNEEAKKCKFNPFDVTKVWPQKDYPLLPVGKLVLDRNPTNYFTEIEQLAFSPAHMVPGIEPSPDKMLQGRLFSYGDSQRYRLGTNYMQIPVNCPYRVQVRNFQRDGAMTVNDNQSGAPNYFPNSFCGPKESSRALALQTCCPVSGDVYRYMSGDTEDNYSQVTDFWTYTLDNCGRKRLIRNISEHLCEASQFLQERAVKLFTAVHSDFGRLLTEALNTARISKL